MAPPDADRGVAAGGAHDAPRVPLVSIGVPVYNGARFLAECLHSILGQAYPNIEVVVCDNASTDGTWEILSGLRDPRLRIFRNDRNIGAFANWNRCVAESRGELVCVFHADDVYEADIVKEEAEFLRAHPEAGAVFSGARLMDADGNLTGQSELPEAFRGGGVFRFTEVLRGMLRCGNFIICPTFMARASALAKAGPFRPERYGTASDAGMWFQLLEHGPIGLIDRPLMRYRVGPHQGTHSIESARTAPADHFRVIDDFLASPSAAGAVPPELAERHETAKLVDEARRLRALVLLGRTGEARELSRRIYTLEAARKYLYNGRRMRYLAKRLLFSVVLETGLGNLAGKVMRTWGSRSST